MQMNDTKKQDNNTKIAMPVCPYCKEEMVLTSYQGYYDSFCYWGCNCDDEALEKKVTEKWRGTFA